MGLLSGDVRSNAVRLTGSIPWQTCPLLKRASLEAINQRPGSRDHFKRREGR